MTTIDCWETNLLGSCSPSDTSWLRPQRWDIWHGSDTDATPVDLCDSWIPPSKIRKRAGYNNSCWFYLILSASSWNSPDFLLDICKQFIDKIVIWWRKNMWSGICVAWLLASSSKRVFIMRSCACTDWGTCGLNFWQMYRMSCIIYVHSLSCAQKPDVPSINESLCSKHAGAWRRKPNNNKHAVFCYQQQPFWNNWQKDFSGLLTAGGLKTLFFFSSQCFSRTWIYLFIYMVSSHYQVDEGVSFCSQACAASRSAVLAGRRWALRGLNKQLWHMGRTYSKASHWSSRGD